MLSKTTELEITYQFEPSPAATVSSPVEWMNLANWMFRFAPLSIGSTPIAKSTGALSSLLCTSPSQLRRDRVIIGAPKGIRLRSITLPDGRRLVRSYDTTGRLSKIACPDGQVIEYQEQGNSVTVFAGNALRIICSRDAAGRLESTQYLSVKQENIKFFYEWLPNGLFRAVKYPDGVEVRFRWDRVGRLAGLTDGQHSITYEWSNSRQLAKFAYSSAESSIQMDLSGLDFNSEWQLTDHTETGGMITPIGIINYDTTGRFVSLLRWDGNRIVFSYDSASRIVAVYTGAGATFIERSHPGEIKSLVQPNGIRFCWHRDNRIGMELIVGASSVTRLERDSRGRVSAVRDGTGSSVRYSYGMFQTSVHPRSIYCAKWGKLLMQYYSNERLKGIQLSGKGKCSFRYRSDGQLRSVKLTGGSRDIVESIRIAGWLFALNHSNANVFQDSLEWSHLVH